MKLSHTAAREIVELIKDAIATGVDPIGILKAQTFEPDPNGWQRLGAFGPKIPPEDLVLVEPIHAVIARVRGT
jgi:hypothetical protein